MVVEIRSSSFQFSTVVMMVGASNFKEKINHLLSKRNESEQKLLISWLFCLNIKNNLKISF